MNRFLVVVALSASVLVGCKDKHSPSCKSGVALTAPWTSLGIPIDDGRVCSSSSDEAKVEFTSGSKDEWMNAFEAKIVAAGYKKKDCKSSFCVYTKDKARVTLHGIETKNWRTLILRSR